MNISKIAKQAERLVSDNSPAILTALGVTGVITTAYLTGKASFRAAEILADERYARNSARLAHEPRVEDFDNREKFKLLWKLYVPAVTAGTLSCIAIVGSHRIGTRRAAAVATAWSLSERAYTEYRDKVVEKLGEKEEREIREEIAHQRVQRDLNEYGIESIGSVDGKVLCHDAYSGRFFWSTIETVNKAVNDVNREININNSASISDFYDGVGLSHTSISDEFGWNTAELLSLEWTTVAGPQDNSPAAHSFDFASRPIMRPWSSASFR